MESPQARPRPAIGECKVAVEVPDALIFDPQLSSVTEWSDSGICIRFHHAREQMPES
jgi:hypothetical protein